MNLLLISLRNDAAAGHLVRSPCAQFVMATLDTSWRLVANDVPVALLGQPEDDAANVMLRVAALAATVSRLIHASSAKRTFPIVFAQAMAPAAVAWIVLQGDLSVGLSICSNGAPLWTTTTILRIRTAVRRFLTTARRSLRRGRDSGFGLRCPIYSGSVTRWLANWTEGTHND